MTELLRITDHRPLVAVAPVLGLAVYCLTHVVAARIIRGRNPYPALAVGALAGRLGREILVREPGHVAFVAQRRPRA